MKKSAAFFHVHTPKGAENHASIPRGEEQRYTVMSNHHLRNKDLSLKAKGLLSQMLSLPEDVVHMTLDFLPLKSYANIVEGNALRTEWTEVIAKHELSYIMGNPPFVGAQYMTKVQKTDLMDVFCNNKKAGVLDFVAGWYHKASELMQNSSVRTAFVSTNSITQGEQVAALWKQLYEQFKIHIDFAHRTFRWDSEASIKAHVHCVIVGFSVAPYNGIRRIYTSERATEAKNINPYFDGCTYNFH